MDVELICIFLAKPRSFKLLRVLLRGIFLFFSQFGGRQTISFSHILCEIAAAIFKNAVHSIQHDIHEAFEEFFIFKGCYPFYICFFKK